MSTIFEDEAKIMTEQEKKDYCYWCFYKDYGNCAICALEKERSSYEQS